MQRPRRRLYAWFNERGPEDQRFRISMLPPDAPVRRSVGAATKADIMAIAAKQRAEVYWWPPLPEGV